MPRARKSTTRTRRPEAAPSDNVRARLIDAAFVLAASKGWRDLGMGEIAESAGLSLAESYVAFRTKPGLLAGFTRQINEAVLAGGAAEGTPQEKLFELMMRRFDALKPRRPGLRAIMRDSIGDPAALCGIPITLNAMAWMLEGAGISAEGWRGRLRRVALTGAYAATFRTFLGDDSDDLAKTMAVLDRRLKAGPFRGNAAAKPA